MSTATLDDSLEPAIVPEAAALRRRAVRGGSVLLGSRLAIQVFTSLVTVLVARFLRPYDYGVLAAGSLFLGLADLLAEAGVGKALVQRRELGKDDLNEGFTLSLIVSLVLYAGLWVFAGPIAAFWRCPELVVYLRVAGGSLLLTPLQSVPLAVLEHRLALERQSAIYVMSAVIQSCLTLGLAVTGFGYWSLVIGTMTARALQTVVLLWQARWVPHLRRPGASTQSLIRFGLSFVGAGLLWYLYSNADFAILGRLAGPVALGFYAVAFNLVSMPVQKLTVNCNQILYPVFCRMQHDPERLKNWFLRLTVLLGFIGFPVMVGMGLVADDGITLALGAKWRPAVLPFQLLCGAGVVMILSTSLPALFNAMGRPDVNFKYALGCALIFPASFYAMGSRYGTVGIALTWSLLYPVIIAILITLTRSLTGFGVRELLQAQRPTLIAVLIMAAAVLGTQWLLADSRFAPLRLGLAIAVGVTSYAGVIGTIARHTVLADLQTLWREFR